MYVRSIFLLAIAAACPAADTAEQLHPGTVTRAVRKELYQRDLIEWSDELARQLDEADVTTLMTALDVFIRAGQPERISRAIEKLGASKSGWLHAGGFWPERLLKLEYYTQARQWFDSVEPNICTRDLMKAFIRHWEATGDLDELEAWLKAKADGGNRPDAGELSDQWAYLYYGHLARRKKLSGYVDGLAKQIRGNPTRREPIFRYLAARRHLDGVKPSLEWLGKIAEPVHALDAFELAQMMKDEQIESAIRLLDRCSTLPVTDYDRQWFNKRSRCAAYFPPDKVETTLRRWTKTRLAGACFAAKKLDRAQKLVEELTGKKDGTLDDLGPLWFAGQVQAATGQRVVEGKIKQAEELQKDSEQYWLARAEYYIGRKENGEAEKAYKKAIALKPGPNRFSVVWDYGRFLDRLGRQRDAETLFRSELDRVGVGDSESESWIQRLKNLDGNGGASFAWDDPLIWQWLALRRKSYFGDKAQGNLAWCWDKAAGQRSKFWAKAEALAGETPPGAVDYILARLLAQEGNKVEAVKRMAAAWARWTNNDAPSRHQAGSELMRLYVDQGNWEEAEKMLLSLRDVAGFGGSDERDWLARLAIAAARADSKDDAMRLWQQRAGQDLTDHRGLSELASHGLRQRLAAYYAGLAQRAPGNCAIAAALKELAEPEKRE